MSAQVSPFAALTGAEKQIKWLEYQSIQLPYVHSQIDGETDELQKAVLEKKNTDSNIEKRSVDRSSPLPLSAAARPLTPRPRPQYSQYDAVIARMKQAERKATTPVLQPSKQAE